jgi:hypothetical protein
MKYINRAPAALLLLSAAASICTRAEAADGPVRDYYCNGIPLGPCAMPESFTRGKVFEYCQPIPMGNMIYQQCVNVRVVRGPPPPHLSEKQQ